MMGLGGIQICSSSVGWCTRAGVGPASGGFNEGQGSTGVNALGVGANVPVGVQPAGTPNNNVVVRGFPIASPK